MVKYILIMIICSGIPGNQCKPIPVPISEFKEYHECIIYGYDYSSTMLKTAMSLKCLQRLIVKNEWQLNHQSKV